MANMTDSFEKEILDGVLGVTALTTPATVYLALFLADPTESGDVTNEVVADDYARLSLDTLFSAATSDTSVNTSDITFPTTTSAWGAVSHIGYMKSGTKTADDMMVYSALDTIAVVGSGHDFVFPVGNLSLKAL